MAKVYIVPHQKRFAGKLQWLLNILLIVVVFISTLGLIYKLNQYNSEIVIHNELKDKYDNYHRSTNNIVDRQKNESLDFKAVDIVMQSRLDGVDFDHMKTSLNSALQIEGSTLKPEVIGNIVLRANELGLKLQINQVQADNEQKVLFELRVVP